MGNVVSIAEKELVPKSPADFTENVEVKVFNKKRSAKHNMAKLKYISTRAKDVQFRPTSITLSDSHSNTCFYPQLDSCMVKSIFLQDSIANAEDVRSMPLPELKRQSSEGFRDEMKKAHQGDIMEYQAAKNAIVISDDWMYHTKIQRCFKFIDGILNQKENHNLKTSLCDTKTVDVTVVNFIVKAYPNLKQKEAKILVDAEHGCSIYNAFVSLSHSLQWRTPYFIYSLQLLTQKCSSDTLMAKISEVCDRAFRCPSAQRQAFNLILSEVSSSCIDQTNSDHAIYNYSTKDGALKRLYECFEDYLDDHKEKAFISAFIEPARFYFQLLGDTSGRDHVNIHGLNWYQTILYSTLRVQLPLHLQINDDCNLGFVSFWEGLNDSAWQQFSDSNSFGLSFEGIKGLRQNQSTYIKSYSVIHGRLPNSNPQSTAKNAAISAIDNASSNQNIREQIALYLDRFAYFFSRDFFIKKCFEVLNSEMKPEHVGFRNAAETLYEIYRRERIYDDELPTAETFVEYCYTDDSYSLLDIEKAENFFTWLGLLKAKKRPEQTYLKNAAISNTIEGSVLKPWAVTACSELYESINLNSSTFSGDLITTEESSTEVECPICMELKPNDQKVPIEHLDSLYGDFSSHWMCRDCTERYKGQFCPFCNEIMQKNNLVQFISDFLHQINHSNHDDPNDLAALFEEWQLFEMENESHPEVVSRVAGLLLQDSKFGSLMDKSIATTSAWVRDSAGIFFRLHCMCMEGEIKAPTDLTNKLDFIVNSIILGPLEATNFIRLSHEHYYGAFYQQALSAWLSAFRMRTKTNKICEIVRRVAEILVRFINEKPNEISRKNAGRLMAERIHTHVITLAHIPVWGSQENDIVWNTVFKFMCN